MQEWNKLQEEFEFTQKVAGLAGGLIYALTDEQSTENLAKCIQNQKQFVQEIEDAYLLISTRRKDNVLVGISHLKSTIDTMPKYLSQCNKAKTHVR